MKLIDNKLGSIRISYLFEIVMIWLTLLSILVRMRLKYLNELGTNGNKSILYVNRNR